jgi:5-methylcytosine-specific restriction endonuclease McrA
MTRKQWSNRPGRSSKWCSKAKRLALYLRDRFECQYCGRDLSTAAPHEVTLDHLKPQVKQGGHAPTNLITACAACNCGRKERPWWKYATSGALYRIRLQRRRALNLPLARAILRGDVSRKEGLAQSSR